MSQCRVFCLCAFDSRVPADRMSPHGYLPPLRPISNPVVNSCNLCSGFTTSLIACHTCKYKTPNVVPSERHHSTQTTDSQPDNENKEHVSSIWSLWFHTVGDVHTGTKKQRSRSAGEGIPAWAPQPDSVQSGRITHRDTDTHRSMRTQT